MYTYGRLPETRVADLAPGLGFSRSGSGSLPVGVGLRMPPSLSCLNYVTRSVTRRKHGCERSIFLRKGEWWNRQTRRI